jgi:hypothetical protein
MTESTPESISGQTNTPIAGQMTWRLPGQVEPLLHLRPNAMADWKPYTECPEYMAPDHAHFSPGYATFIKLLKQNWVVLKLA